MRGETAARNDGRVKEQTALGPSRGGEGDGASRNPKPPQRGVRSPRTMAVNRYFAVVQPQSSHIFPDGTQPRMYHNLPELSPRLRATPRGIGFKLATLCRHQLLKVDDVLLLRREDGTMMYGYVSSFLAILLLFQ
jgi:hypothetical protein